MASSQVRRENAALPFGPTRPIGCWTLAAPCTRSPKRRTFAQMNPPVTGFRREPSSVVTRPALVLTSKLQESGQSSGQAVWVTWSCLGRDVAMHTVYDS